MDDLQRAEDQLAKAIEHEEALIAASGTRLGIIHHKWGHGSPIPLELARDVATNMNRVHGVDTHWVEKVEV